MGRDHAAVGVLVEHDAQVVEPLDGVGRFHDQAAQQLRPGGEMTAAESVQIVLDGRIVLLVGGLNATLGHHGVGVADAQLGDDHDLRPRLVGFDGSAGARAAAADDQNVHVIVDLVQVGRAAQQTAVGVQQVGQLHGSLLALLGPTLISLKPSGR